MLERKLMYAGLYKPFWRSDVMVLRFCNVGSTR